MAEDGKRTIAEDADAIDPEKPSADANGTLYANKYGEQDTERDNMVFENDDLIDLMMVFPRKASNVSRTMVSKYLGDSRIKPYHLLILRVMSNHNGVSQKDLVDRLPFDKSYISTGVRELMDMGMIVNESEGKVHSLRLTDLGKDIVVMGNMTFMLVDQAVFGFLTKEERQTLIELMRRIDAHTTDLMNQISESDS
mgnify:FL=1